MTIDNSQKMGYGYANSGQLVTSKGVNFRLGANCLPGLVIRNEGPSTAYIVINARTYGARGCNPQAVPILTVSNPSFNQSYEMNQDVALGEMLAFANFSTSTLTDFNSIANKIIWGDTFRAIRGQDSTLPVGVPPVTDYIEFPIRAVTGALRIQLDLDFDITSLQNADVATGGDRFALFEVYREQDGFKADNRQYWLTQAQVLARGCVLKSGQSQEFRCFQGNPKIYSFTAVTADTNSTANLNCAQIDF